MPNFIMCSVFESLSSKCLNLSKTELENTFRRKTTLDTRCRQSGVNTEVSSDCVSRPSYHTVVMLHEIWSNLLAAMAGT